MKQHASYVNNDVKAIAKPCSYENKSKCIAYTGTQSVMNPYYCYIATPLTISGMK